MSREDVNDKDGKIRKRAWTKKKRKGMWNDEWCKRKERNEWQERRDIKKGKERNVCRGIADLSKSDFSQPV